MYSNTSCRIKFHNGLGPIFQSTCGVKQGDVLSPLLFNIFINDLIKELEFPESKAVRVGNEELNILLYADDIILLSESNDGLQHCLDRLHNFCSSWNLEVNVEKSKVVVFNSNGKTHKNCFLYDGNIVETVDKQCYLGITMKCNGNFN